MGIKIETVHAGEYSMDFFRFGEGKKTFVILPGISIKRVMDSAEFVAQDYAVMGREYTVYVFERRSELPSPYPLEQMAEDTAEVFRQLGLGEICLFGASQGSMMAMLIAIRHPELVKKLVLGSSSAHVDPHLPALESWLALAGKKDGPELFRDFGRRIYAPDTFRRFEKALTSIGKSVTDEEFARFMILAEATRGFDVLGELTNIRCPVLLLGARDDAVLGVRGTLAIWEALKDRPDVQCHIYEAGYGHAAYDMAPDYKERILAFLEKSPEDAPVSSV